MASRGVRVGVWLAAFLVPVLLFGSFWYVRAWIEYGSPTYPYEVSIGGVEVFSGLPLGEVNQPPASLLEIPPGPLRTLRSWTHLTDATGYAPLLGGFGPQWLLLELPALLVFSGYLVVRRRQLLFTFVVPFVVMLAATPSNWWTRFTIAFVAPGAVAVPWVIEHIRQRTVVLLLQGATVVLVAIGCLSSTDRVTVAGRIFTAGDIVDRATDPASDRTLAKLVLPAYAWTDIIPRDSRVGVVPDELPSLFEFPWVYQLFGSDFRNDVVALDPRTRTPTIWSRGSGAVRSTTSWRSTGRRRGTSRCDIATRSRRVERRRRRRVPSGGPSPDSRTTS